MKTTQNKTLEKVVLINQKLGKDLLNLIFKDSSEGTFTSKLYEIAKQPVTFIGSSDLTKNIDEIWQKSLTRMVKIHDTIKNQEDIEIYNALIHMLSDCTDWPIRGYGSNFVDNDELPHNRAFICCLGEMIEEFAHKFDANILI